jgi:hypothetical protein
MDRRTEGAILTGAPQGCQRTCSRHKNYHMTKYFIGLERGKKTVHFSGQLSARHTVESRLIYLRNGSISGKK